MTSPASMPAEPQWRPPRLSVVVPTYKERDNVLPLLEKLDVALAGIDFEVIFVDDNSPDGTAEAVKQIARTRPDVRCIHRIGRRGLSSACIEGMALSAAEFVAVIDGDLQHDESILPVLLERVEAGADIAVGSRYVGAGRSDEGLSAGRQAGSRLATRLSGILTGKALADPMSGFFLLRRALVMDVAPHLSQEGFKILLDLVATAGRRRGGRLNIAEVPYSFRPRHAGESKMSPLIVAQFLGLIVSQLTRGLVPTSFLLFGLVGVSGVFVHLAVLSIAFEALGLGFAVSQFIATMIAMTTNFVLNNELTYADKRLTGRRFFTGLLSFYAVCSFGTFANISVASLLFTAEMANFVFAGIAGAVMSAVFNYAVTRIFTWR